MALSKFGYDPHNTAPPPHLLNSAAPPHFINSSYSDPFLGVEEDCRDYDVQRKLTAISKSKTVKQTCNSALTRDRFETVQKRISLLKTAGNITTEDLRSDEREQLRSDETEQLSSDQREQLSSDETEQLSSDETEQLSSDEREQLSSDETEQWRSDETEQLSSDETEQLSSDEREQLSSDETEQLSSDETEQLSSDEREQLSSDETEQWRSDETEQWRSDEREQLSSDQREQLSSDETEQLSSDETEQLSSDQREQLSSDETEQWRSDETEQLSSDETEQLSSDEREQLSSDETEQLSSDETEQWRSDETEQLRSDEREQLRSDQREQLRSDETEQLSSDETEQWRSDEREQLSSDETEQLSSDETEQLSSDEREQLSSDQREQLSSDETEQWRSDETEQLSSDEREQLSSDETEQLSSDEREQLRSDEREQFSSDETEQLSSDEREQLSSDEREQLSSDETEQLRSDEREQLGINQREELTRDKPEQCRNCQYENTCSVENLGVKGSPFFETGETIEGDIYEKKTEQAGCTETESESAGDVRYRREWDRYASYLRFPLNSTWPSRLAAAGFYYTGSGDRVVCFSCGQSYDHWRPADNPMAVHRQISPSCRFVLGEEGNEPIRVSENAEQRLQEFLGRLTVPVSEFSAIQSGTLHNQSESESSVSENELFGVSETPRNNVDDIVTSVGHENIDISVVSLTGTLASATNTSCMPTLTGNICSIPSSTFTLTSAVNTSDMATNTVSLPGNATVPSFNGHSSVSGDAVASNDSHQSSSQLNLSNLPILQLSGFMSGSSSTSAPKLHAPRHSDYVDVQRRILSFQHRWPHPENESPRELAEAGFFFSCNSRDSTSCFYCGGGLRNWMQGDNPYVEHARWFPQCAFIRQVKGDNFVDLVQEMNENEVEIDYNQVMDILNDCRPTVERLGIKTRQADGFVVSEGRSDEFIETTRNTEHATEGSLPDDNEELICKVCLENKIRMVFLPCGHLCCCEHCASRLRRCRICRKIILATVRASFC